MPAGTRLECVAHFDNSTNNPDNPDPTRSVTFGNESYDEMMIGFVDMVVKDGRSPASVEQQLTTRLHSLHEKHPGEVWVLDVRETDEQESGATALWLPSAGEGVWIIPMNGQLQETRVTEIRFDGKELEATVVAPFGTFPVAGKLDDGRLEGIITIPFDEDNLWFGGEIYDGQPLSGGGLHQHDPAHHQDHPAHSSSGQP